MRTCLRALQTVLYRVVSKWEPEGPVLSWGEFPVVCCPACLSLHLKGAEGVRGDLRSRELWDFWPDWWSLKCPMVLQSMVPALVWNSLTSSSNNVTMAGSVCTIVAGFGCQRYLWE